MRGQAPPGGMQTSRRRLVAGEARPLPAREPFPQGSGSAEFSFRDVDDTPRRCLTPIPKSYPSGYQSASRMTPLTNG